MTRHTGTWWRLGMALMLAAVLVGGSSCRRADGPCEAVHGFAEAINRGRTDEAMEYLCGNALVVRLLPGLRFEELACSPEKVSASEATIRASGSVAAGGGPIQLRLAFDCSVPVERTDGGRWCLPMKSLLELGSDIVLP